MEKSIHIIDDDMLNILCRAAEDMPRELYLHIGDDGYTAVDNSTAEGWTEYFEFGEFAEAVLWLLREKDDAVS